MVDGTLAIAFKFATPEKLQRSTQELFGVFYRNIGAFAMKISRSLTAVICKAGRKFVAGITYIVFYTTKGLYTRRSRFAHSNL